MAFHSRLADTRVETCCGLPLLPLNTSCPGPAPAADGPDIIDESLDLYRPNCMFQSFEFQGAADKLLVYLQLFVCQCLKRKIPAYLLLRSPLCPPDVSPSSSKRLPETHQAISSQNTCAFVESSRQACRNPGLTGLRRQRPSLTLPSTTFASPGTRRGPSEASLLRPAAKRKEVRLFFSLHPPLRLCATAATFICAT